MAEAAQIAYLHTRLAQIYTEPVCILAVVLHEILQIPERSSPGDEEATLVQLADAVVLDSVAVAHCNNPRYIPSWVSIGRGLMLGRSGSLFVPLSLSFSFAPRPGEIHANRYSLINIAL